MSSIIEVTGLTKVYPPEKKGGKAFTAVNGISFSLNKGEILGLLGPNGAGKSTSIFMMLGVLTPTAGQIKYFDKDFSTHRSEIMNHVTFASTYISMPWRLTVIENLRIYGYLYGLTKQEFNSRSEKFMKKFGVWDQRNKDMQGLSAGQLTRIMLAKAFIPHPKIVLLDEPTASLDPEIAHQVRDFVKNQQQEFNTSILYTSHNMDEVSDVCDRVMFLNHGQITAIDTPENLAATISEARMRLQVKDGLKRTAKFAKALGLPAKIDNREIEITLEETKIADFLSRLAAEGIEYTQISIDKPTLEDYFLSMSKK